MLVLFLVLFYLHIFLPKYTILKYLTDHELHEDGGHADTVPGTNTLEHVLALGWLGSILLPDGSELLQHLELGLPKVGLHVGVPAINRLSMSALPLLCNKEPAQ